MLLGRLLEKADQPVPRVLGDEALLGERDELLHAVLEQRVDQLLLVREAPVDGSDADARALRDRVERHGQALLGERLAGGGEDPQPVALRVASQWAV